MNSTDLELVREIIASRAIVLVRSRYEDVPFSRRLFYHDTVHAHEVRERALKIARAMDLPDRQLILTDIAAAFHDSVQAWHPVEKGNGVVIRQRHTGRNEMASTQEAVDAMSDSDIEFTPEEYITVAFAILATTPAWGVEHGTVIQPFLTIGSHPVARAVALADLGAAGMDPDCFVRDWKALFAEEQLDIMEKLVSAKRTSEIDGATQDSYRARYVSWLESQARFARGRRERLNDELLGLGREAKDRVRALFSHFDRSVELAEAASKLARKQNFALLMRQLWPHAFHDEAW